jgi:hypothetical protein
MRAAEWYEDRRTGLGEELIAAVENAVQLIREAPERWPRSPLDPRARRVLLERFPLSINYVISGDVLFSAAVAHFSRRPEYWIARLSQEPGSSGTH